MKIHNQIKGKLLPFMSLHRDTLVSELPTDQDVNDFQDDFPALCDELECPVSQNLVETKAIIDNFHDDWFEDNSQESKVAQNIESTLASVHKSLRY